MSHICPQCAAEMKREESRTEVVKHKGDSLTVTGLAGWFCTACEEAIFDDESALRYGAAGDTLIAKSRERQQAEIRRIRKKLGLTQIEAGQLVGVGKIAFSRYERGESQAPGPLVKLLRLVDQHPELIAEVRVA
ncbi:type II toxin-antitoxin system MqsA family antitoxin [Propionivibrio sp.]|uniref:type II toxin-antitoxin system MqsA family antitoxin n=1 Tax=Propionivibrio sp. TaxID=2212460 RepID=UPI003BF0F125